MGRIEDDRDAARQAERVALARREQEKKAKEQQTADSAFSRLVQSGKTAKAKEQADALGKSAIAQLLEEQGAARSSKERAAEKGTLADRARTQMGEKLSGQARSEQRSGAAAHEEGRQAAGKSAEAASNQSASTEQLSHENVAEGRRMDARSTREALSDRTENAQQSASSKGAQPGKEKNKTDADGGGGQQKGKDQGSSQNPGSFRFNPALMAPVPVAQANPNQGSDKLRALATEIAQKIVERVRVGTNAAGKAEFQIDLRSDVLAGLSIKVSSSNGKIRAQFCSNDRKVLAMLKDHWEILEKALGGRGLRLEQLEIEERA